MNPTTRREAMVAFGHAIDELQKKAAGDNIVLTEQTVSMLQHWFLSGVKWGLDHEFLERGGELSRKGFLLPPGT